MRNTAFAGGEGSNEAAAPLHCRHFGQCGGCTLQALSPEAYRDLKRARIERVLAQHALNVSIDETVTVPARSRRRAVFKAKRTGNTVAVGFRAGSSHTIVDMRECCILTPSLFGFVAGLRATMRDLLSDGAAAEIHVTETKTGFDVALRWKNALSLDLARSVSPWLSKLGIARLSANGETLAMLASPSVDIAGCDVKIPPECFLQPTKSGEVFIEKAVADALAGARSIVDLFAGCGTIALALARQAAVHAVETDRGMLDSLSDAAKRSKGRKAVSAERRDLFKLPLTAKELARYDGVSLDPPRAGAQAQVAQLARSPIAKIAYTSCNPESFGRDARVLVNGGYSLRSVVPIDQFLLSDHIELVGVFDRRSG